MNPYGIGIDLGGTRIKGAAYELATGRELAQSILPTRDGKFGPEGVPQFALSTRSVIADLENQLGQRAVAIGLSAPGLADAQFTKITYMQGRMQGLAGFEWRDFLSPDPSVPLAVLNDAQAALMGEIWLGAAKGLNDVIMLTLGTGVGGAIVSGGRLLSGAIGRAGHLGHLSLDPWGAPSPVTGCPGNLEDAIGNHNVSLRTGGRFTDTRSLLNALSHGDELAQQVWLKSVEALGAAIVGFINVLDPAVVLLGGGISSAGDLLLDPLRDYLARYEWRPGGQTVEIKLAALGEMAGTAGALFQSTCLLERQSKRST